MSYTPEQLTPKDAAARIRKLRGGVAFFLMVGQHISRPDNLPSAREKATGCASVTKKGALEWLAHLDKAIPPGYVIAVDFPKPEDAYSPCCFIGQSA